MESFHSIARTTALPKLVSPQQHLLHLSTLYLSWTLPVSVSNLRICIFAADVSPVDVYSHLPVQCETNNIPYIFIRSRLELGTTGT